MSLERQAIINWANEGNASFPRLALDSPRETILSWLLANDPNGIYTDANNRREYGEDADLVTLEEAWELLTDCFKENEEEAFVERVFGKESD